MDHKPPQEAIALGNDPKPSPPANDPKPSPKLSCLTLSMVHALGQHMREIQEGRGALLLPLSIKPVSESE